MIHMTYEITPEHFGVTTRVKILLVVVSLTCFALPMIIFPPWSLGAIITGLMTWLFLGVYWYFDHNFSLEVGDDSVRVVGGRVIRKGQVRYLREFDSGPLRGGPRLVLSEHVPTWVRLFGGAIVIPKGLPAYDQIKQKVLTWMVDSAAHAM
jgi:hypothetical protein